MYIYGCGGHARCVCDVLLINDKKASIIFVDENSKDGEIIMGFPTIKNVESLENINFYAIGDNDNRKKLFDVNKNNLIRIISKLTYIGKNSIIENGTFIGNYCNIGAEVNIGFNCIINTGAIIEHQSKIGNHCHISVRSTVCGQVEIGNCVFIGAGAIIIDKVKICSNVTIGAGATVINDINESGVYVGTPARRIK